jgi:hypothetical protein
MFELPAGKYFRNDPARVCQSCAEKRLSPEEFKSQLERKPPATTPLEVLAALVFIAAIVGLALLGFEDMERNGWYIRP